MMKKLKIAGIELDNYTVRELSNRVSKLMSEKPLVIAQEVDMDVLMLAEEDEVVRKALEASDVTIISELGILEAAGALTVSNIQRKHEISNHLQFNDMMKKTERNRRTVYILGETAEQTELVREFLEQEYTELKIAGIGNLEDCNGESETIVNDINSATADTIISLLSSPVREYFLLENKDKILAGLWYGVSGSNLSVQSKGLKHVINKYIKKRKLVKHINNYEGKEE